jgi:hypothetical protein
MVTRSTGKARGQFVLELRVHQGRLFDADLDEAQVLAHFEQPADGRLADALFFGDLDLAHIAFVIKLGNADDLVDAVGVFCHFFLLCFLFFLFSRVLCFIIADEIA